MSSENDRGLTINDRAMEQFKKSGKAGVTEEALARQVGS